MFAAVSEESSPGHGWARITALTGHVRVAQQGVEGIVGNVTRRGAPTVEALLTKGIVGNVTCVGEGRPLWKLC